MQRTIASLMFLGILTSGCGGGTSGSVDAPVTVGGPQITLTPSSTSVDGGETVAITVRAVDAGGATLPYTLTCNGGRVVGDLLVTSAVTSDTIISCTASASDSGGRTATGQTTVTVRPATTTLSMFTPMDTITSGSMFMLLPEGLNLDSDEYSGKLGDRTVPVYVVNGQLIAGIPQDEAPGDKLLTIQIGSKLYSFPVRVQAAPVVQNPKQALATWFTAAHAQLNDMLAQAPAMSDADRTRFESARDQYANASTLVAGLSDTEASSFASFLVTNGIMTPTGDQPNIDFIKITGGQDCGDKWNKFRKPAGFLLLGGGLMAFSLKPALAAALVPPAFASAGTAHLFSVFIGASLVGANIRATFNNFSPMFTSCYTERDVSFNFTGFEPDSRRPGNYVQAITVEQKHGFSQNEARKFTLQRTFEPGDYVKPLITPLLPRVVSAIRSIPLLPASVQAEVDQLVLTGTMTVPASRITLGSISKSKIAGSLSRDGDNVILTFRSTEDPLPRGNIDFEFVLNRQEEEQVRVTAQLSIDTPEAEDAAITLIQGRPITSTLQIRGAETVEIVKQPSQGTVSIQPDGALSYTPSATFFGTEEFTYRAKNKAGYSRVATVLLTINRQFDGLWKITSASRTAAQSQPGLCPNEDNEFTLYITKVNDTRYTAAYDGATINLTMASKDDPNGLSGSLSAEYEDGPGTTKETLTVSIPDSNRLNALTTWSYKGPENTFCNGTTTITGRR